MSFTDYITNHGKKVNKNAFIHLVQISRIDGNIGKEEFDLLHKEGKKFGLTDPEIDRIINSEKDHHYHPPYALEEKFEHLYNLAEMILADEVVSESETRMIRKFAIEAGFSYDRIDNVLEVLIEGVKAEEEEEKLFKKFKKTLLH